MSLLDLQPARVRRELDGITHVGSSAPAVAGEESEEEMLDRYARIVWSALLEPGDSIAHRLIRRLGAVAALEVVQGARSPAGMQDGGIDAEALAKGLSRWRPRLIQDAVDDAMRAARRAGVIALVPADAFWPRRLDDLGDHAPVCLWVRGDASSLTSGRPSVALVGARAATGYGENVAMELAAGLVAAGIDVVSGAAYGIDGAAHRAALAAGGTTVALLAGGVDRPYPAGHSDLIRRIVGAGAVAAEVPCGSAPTKWRFLQRNRLIAALSDATVVVEAGWRSGSLNTAAHASTLGRPLGAVPGPITSAASAGCHRLLREQDARCITSVDDVRELLAEAGALEGTGVPPSDARSGAGVASGGGRSGTDARPRTDDRSRVRDALSTRSWRTPDDVARRAGLSRHDAEGLLGLLLLDGQAQPGPDGWRLIARAATGR